MGWWKNGSEMKRVGKKVKLRGQMSVEMRMAEMWRRKRRSWGRRRSLTCFTGQKVQTG